MSQNSRQIAFSTLRAVQRGAFADVALDHQLNKLSPTSLDRRLITELVYGTIRRQRTLDVLIEQFSQKKSPSAISDLQLILRIGLYQLRYLDQIPPSAAVNTTVDLTKINGLGGLSGFVNGLLRQYVRTAATQDPLKLPTHIVSRLGVEHSYPDWMIEVWLEQFDTAATVRLCEWFNRPPHIDLRINSRKVGIDQARSMFQAQGITVQRVTHVPQALRLANSVGAIQQLPGFEPGWWMVQDSSSQLVSHFLDPQPGETVIDVCAAPGSKTTHIAELMNDRGIIWACDRSATRLKKLLQNAERLQLQSIRTHVGDSRNLSQIGQVADRILVDAPCSGLGTLHRHADARWRQTSASVAELTQLQRELLHHAAAWVKPNGILVYSTCTLHPAENEAVIQLFLNKHPDWQIEPPKPHEPAVVFTTDSGWVKVLPHQHDMDGFFMARLRKPAA